MAYYGGETEVAVDPDDQPVEHLIMQIQEVTDAIASNIAHRAMLTKRLRSIMGKHNDRLNRSDAVFREAISTKAESADDF